MKRLLCGLLLLWGTAAFAGGPAVMWLAANKQSASAPTTPVISAAGGNTQVTVSLTSGDAGALTNILYWDTVTRADYSLYANSISNATLVAAGFPGTPYAHTGRTNGTTYYYRLRGTDVAGSTQSNEASATAAITTDTDLTGWTITGTGNQGFTQPGGANTLPAGYTDDGASGQSSVTATKSLKRISGQTITFDACANGANSSGSGGGDLILDIKVNGTQVASTVYTSGVANCPVSYTPGSSDGSNISLSLVVNVADSDSSGSTAEIGTMSVPHN